jgi:hypothetical protein
MKSMRYALWCGCIFNSLRRFAGLKTAVALAVVPAMFASLASGQIYNQHGQNGPQDMPTETVAKEIKGVVKVNVSMDKPTMAMAPRAEAVNASVADGNLTDPGLPLILRNAGITTLRYPGGGFADNYHWSTNKASNSQSPTALRYSGLAPNTDFGHFVHVIDQVGTTVITVNYGSNQDGTGGGEPAEAAAWVAYANGDPNNTSAIGKDSAGVDWQTVGYWASLRASQPLPTDDGKNFLRIGHPQPLNVKYWEVGNEVYKNGYYGGEGETLDLHAPYPKDAKDNEKQRRKNPNLSPATYGKELLAYIKAMKAVDARIKIGASLDSPVQNSWDIQEWTPDPVTGKYVQNSAFQKAQDSGPDWDRNVLQVAGKDIDFVALHWNTGKTTEASKYKDLDNAALLNSPHDELPPMIGGLVDMLHKYCPQNTGIQVLITDIGPKSYIKIPDESVVSLFAADAYLTLVETGIANIDWDALHGGLIDDKNQLTSSYFGLQMIRQFMTYNESLVTAVSSHSLLSAHAVVHKNGSMSLMLINKDPKNTASVKVQIDGGKLTAPGMRFVYGKGVPPPDKVVSGTQADEVGNSFTVSVPPYTITDFLIPPAK